MYKVKCKFCEAEFTIPDVPGKEIVCKECLRKRRKDEDTVTFLAQKRVEHHTRRWVRKAMSPKSRHAGGSWSGK